MEGARRPPAGGLAFVALGSNLGDRERALRDAVAALATRVPVVGASPVYESAAHALPGQAPQPAFLNAVVAVKPTLPPRELLEVLLDVERGLGRRRDTGRWAPRVIDLDLVLYADLDVSEAGLTVPHPRLAGRRFVLAPLADLAPAATVPGANATVADLLNACDDPGVVARTDLSLLS